MLIDYAGYEDPEHQVWVDAQVTAGVSNSVIYNEKGTSFIFSFLFCLPKISIHKWDKDQSISNSGKNFSQRLDKIQIKKDPRPWIFFKITLGTEILFFLITN